MPAAAAVSLKTRIAGRQAARGHVSLAQVYAALAYYHVNQEAMEAEMAAEEADYDRLRREHHAARAQAQA